MIVRHDDRGRRRTPPGALVHAGVARRTCRLHGPGLSWGQALSGESAGTGAAGEAPEGSKQLIKVAKPSHAGTVRVTFALPAAEPSGAVSVVGDFNDWDPYAHPLRRRANGVRSAVVTIPAGSTLRFRYLAEGGIWFDDETAGVRDAHGAVLSVPG